MHLRLAIPLLLLGLGLGRGAANAQTIRGAVRDSAGPALPGTTVLLTDARDSVLAVTLTAAQGQYELRSTPGDTVRVRAERLGYLPMQSQLLVLAAESELEIEMLLRRSPILLQELTITARRQNENRQDFERRRRNEIWGRFADAERLAQVRTPRAIDKLRLVVPGLVATADGIVRVRKRGADLTGVPTCQPRYYIDGVRYPGDISLDAIVQGDLVRAIEYYSDIQQAPGEFALGFDAMTYTGINLDGQPQSSYGLSRPCAIVVIWTGTGFGWDD